MTQKIFLGREQQLTQFANFIQRFFASIQQSKPKVTLIWGQGGMGKSTLLQQLTQQFTADYPTRFQHLAIDWHQTWQRTGFTEDRKHESVDPYTFLAKIEDQLKRHFPKWEKHAKPYRQIQKDLHQAVQALQQEQSRRDALKTESMQKTESAAKTVGDTAGIATSFADGGAILKPVVSKVAQYLARSSIHVFKKNLEQDLAAIEAKHRDLLFNAADQLACGLGKALEHLASDNPLIVSFDTYEIVDQQDMLLREVIRAAGDRVFWILAGRRNLYNPSQPQQGMRIEGYAAGDGHSYELLTMDLPQLAKEDIRIYFEKAAPHQPRLTDPQLDKVYSATHSIPLAINLAAEIWRAEGNLEAIISEDQITNHGIVSDMVCRYRQHCVDEKDNRFLCAMAMADGDYGILKAMLCPEYDHEETRFRQELDRCRQRYAAAQRLDSHFNQPRLHDEPAQFFSAELQEETMRKADWVQRFNQRAVDHLVEKVNDKLDFHTSIEDLYLDDDYLEDIVKLSHHLFWLDPIKKGWPFWTARFIESSVYRRDLKQRLEEVLGNWNHVEKWSKKTWLQLQSGKQNHLAVLKDAQKRGWLKDSTIENRYQAQRQAILYLRETQAQRSQDLWNQALSSIEAAWQHHQISNDPLAKEIANTAAGIGYHFYTEKEWHKSREGYEISVKADPDNHIYVRDLGTVFSLLKQYDKAISLHNKAIEINPRDSYAWRDLGNDYSHLNQYDKAISFLNKAIEINPKDSAAWRELGTAYAMLKQYDKAISFHNKAIEINPNDSHVWQCLGNDYFYLKQYHKVISFLNKAIEINPHDAGIRKNLGTVYSFINQYSQSIRCYKKSLEINDGSPDTWAYLATSHIRLQQWEAAETAFKKGFAVDPNHHELLTRRAWFAMLKGTLKQAEKDLTKALELDSQNYVAHCYLGCLKYRLGIWQDMNDHFQTAYQILPSSTESVLDLAASHKLNASSADHLLETLETEIPKEVDPYDHAAYAALQDDHDQAIDQLRKAIETTPSRQIEACLNPAFHHLRQDPRFRQITQDPPNYPDIDHL